MKIASFNMGQMCNASSRVYVHESIYGQFIAAFRVAADEYTEKSGDPFEPNTLHGPQVSDIQYKVRPCTINVLTVIVI
jgi:acyl-CoA reductase-like NAD-dependent aldehyde dehydrogenase